MGQQQAKPVTTKHSEDGGDPRIGRCFGVSSCQGWRPTMEDAHIAALNVDETGVDLFGVFDGHGGKSVAEFCRHSIQYELLANTLFHKKKDMKTALEAAFMQTDARLAATGARWHTPIPPCDEEGGGGERRDKEGNVEMGEKEEKQEEEEEKGEEKKKQGEEEEGGVTATTGTVDASTTAAAAFGSSLSPPAAAVSPLYPSHPPHPHDDEPPPTSPRFCGSTAVVAVIYNNNNNGVINDSENENQGENAEEDNAGDEENKNNKNKKHSNPILTISNCGDSRAVLSKNGRAVALSTDHKPHNEGEMMRIQNAGGSTWAGRVNGRLAVSRSIGDLQFKQNKDLPADKQMVSAFPEVESVELDETCDLLILACDGVWDVKSNQQVVDFVSARLGTGLKLSQIAEELMDSCIAPDPHASSRGLGCDNMTVVLVTLSERANKLLTQDFDADTGAKRVTLKDLVPPTIYDAVAADDLTLLQNALEYGDSPNGGVGEKDTPLHIAASLGHQRVLQALIDAGGGVELTDNDQKTPLHRAAEGGHVACVELLCQKKANVNALAQHGRDCGWTALHFAADKGVPEVAAALIANGAHIDGSDTAYQSPFAVACGAGHDAMVRLLLQHGIPPDGPEGERRSPLWAAVSGGREGVVRELLEAKALVDGMPNASSTPLHAAAEAGHLSLVKLLLDNGANINAQDEDDATPLLQACQAGYPDVVSLLLQRRADTTIRGFYGRTAVEIAQSLLEPAAREAISGILAAHLKEIGEEKKEGKKEEGGGEEEKEKMKE